MSDPVGLAEGDRAPATAGCGPWPPTRGRPSGMPAAPAVARPACDRSSSPEKPVSKRRQAGQLRHRPGGSPASPRTGPPRSPPAAGSRRWPAPSATAGRWPARGDEPPGGQGRRLLARETTAGRAPRGPGRRARRATAPSSATRAEASARKDRATNSLRPTAATASATAGPSGEPAKTSARASSDPPVLVPQPGEPVEQAVVEPLDQVEGLVDSGRQTCECLHETNQLISRTVPGRCLSSQYRR